jgi:circadian clock protein KaiC
MSNHRNGGGSSGPQLPKALTGITGFDELTYGGLPAGRPTIVCGGPGCGKTMFGMEFLVRGATQFNEPGVLVTFEETADEMARNVASLGFNLKELVARKKLVLEYVRVEPSEIQETGEYDLEGLFIRLQHAVDRIGAKRVTVDTLEAIFSGFSNTGMLRAEIRRMFRWLKDRRLTTVVTAEKGEGTLTRYGLEEYVSDCVIFLDHRTQDQVSTRRMRVIKYRGSSHGADEYPFLIDDRGFSVLPSSSMRLDHIVSNERVSSGIKDLDAMLEGKGYYVGSSILISGTAGSGKSSLAATFAESVCRSGGRCLYVAFEESQSQAVRNMRSIGIDLEKQVRRGLLRFEAWRPTQAGLELHLLRLHKLVQEHRCQAVIIDPITNLVGDGNELHSMLMRAVDFLKSQCVTAFFTSLTSGSHRELEQTEVGISSLIDTWLFVRDVELNGERNRCLYILKSRGMAHSNQVREFVMSRQGIRLVPVYLGGGNVLTGSARLSQEARERAEALLRQQSAEEQRRVLQQKRAALDAQITSLRSQFAQEEARVNLLTEQRERREREIAVEMDKMIAVRGTGQNQKRTGPNGKTD